jgi:hypothetical protein
MDGKIVNGGGTERGGGGFAPLEGSQSDMLIQSLKQHFPARFPEWVNSGILASWGAYVLLHPELFTQEATRHIFAGMAEMVWVDYPPSVVWGLTAFVVGTIRAVALFINGAYSRTPLVRLATSAVSAFVWAQVVIGLFGVVNAGLIIYSWLVVIDIASAYRAGVDVAIAEKHRRDSRLRRGIGRVDHSEYSSIG